jgi:hypothetical protein
VVEGTRGAACKGLLVTWQVSGWCWCKKEGSDNRERADGRGRREKERRKAAATLARSD